ncbi:hypothetical protein GCM10010967_33440 [Dyadobacter beijingensis]|uniref:DUF4374 domain-containing protein n=1 Tax=Dyadobacter beijingensis TaxID=365489 RepID=A0ABQ2I2F0_9BACT|nr:hypothetical protein [Dyadobacter beijingensis]GGM96953.1 hypothetical protein GCM10010967_33440 [Dyadobacter beijingensis]
MLRWTKAAIFSFVSLLFCASLAGCSHSGDARIKRYSIVTGSVDGGLYIYQTDNLDSGAVDPIAQGVKLAGPPRIWYYLLVRDGFYYYVDSKSEYFVKAQVRDERFVHLDSVHVPDFSYPDNALFTDGDTAFLVSHSMGVKPKLFAKVNTGTMQATIGTLPLPHPEKPFDNMSVGFEMWREGHLWMGYTYHYANRTMGYGSSDTVYVARMTYPGLALEHVDKDPRSTYPGNVNTAQQNTFADEAGDFYFMSSPGIVRGANPDQPTGIYRIKKGGMGIDSAYFFNVSASPVQNHAYGLWYLGNHKALLRSERKDLFKTYKEHYMVPQMEYYEVDLLTRQVRKLDLPLDRGSSRTCVLVQGEKAYITINDGKGNNDVWIYRAASRSLTKGLHLKGNVDYIYRIDRLYE